MIDDIEVIDKRYSNHKENENEHENENQSLASIMFSTKEW